MTHLDYGPVYVIAGRFNGRIMYYDDDDSARTTICYAGHPLHFPGCYTIPKRFLKEPLVGELVSRQTEIQQALMQLGVKGNKKEWPLGPSELHGLWSESSLIDNILFERRLSGQMNQISNEKSIFLCHSSSDKGFVRMVNDDLRNLGAKTWLDENNVKVGESIVGKISNGLKESSIMIIFLSKVSVTSLWTTKEWQSFLSRQLAGDSIRLLPILIENCHIPEILADLKYANFKNSYEDGFKELLFALV